MPAISGSSPSRRTGVAARRAFASCRRAVFICCFSWRARALARLCWVGLDFCTVPPTPAYRNSTATSPGSAEPRRVPDLTGDPFEKIVDVLPGLRLQPRSEGDTLDNLRSGPVPDVLCQVEA